MCIICLEFQNSRDIADARRMLESARREIDVIKITEEHLKQVEQVLNYKEKIAKDEIIEDKQNE